MGAAGKDVHRGQSDPRGILGSRPMAGERANLSSTIGLVSTLTDTTDTRTTNFSAYAKQQESAMSVAFFHTHSGRFTTSFRMESRFIGSNFLFIDILSRTYKHPTIQAFNTTLI